MAVKARITAIKANGESIVERVSATRVHAEASTGDTLVEVIARADGRVSIEVRHGHQVIQSLNLREDGSRIMGSIVDGKASLL